MRKSKPVFEHKDLVEIAVSVGLDGKEAETLLSTDLLEDQVKEDQAIAHQLGANGVPFFVFDMKYGISGAQPQEVFDQTLIAALAEAD